MEGYEGQRELKVRLKEQGDSEGQRVDRLFLEHISPQFSYTAMM